VPAEDASCVDKASVCLSVSALAIEPTSVTSKPSRIHVIPSPMTTSQCQRLHGSRSSRFGMFVSTVLPVAPSSPVAVTALKASPPRLKVRYGDNDEAPTKGAAGRCYTHPAFGGVAQRLERRTHNPQVGGSNPPAAILLRLQD
jgi:hypothetical protein